MFCSNCGSQIGENEKFCKVCGTPVKVQAAAPVMQQVPVYQQPVPQVTATVPAAPVQMPAQQIQTQNANPVNKMPTAAKVLGWISMVLSCLGIIGMVLVFVATAMPSGSGVEIDSEGGARLAVFFIGICLGSMLSPVGGLLGIISTIIMLTKRNKKMIWLPITGIVLGAVAFIGSILGIVALGGSLS